MCTLHIVWTTVCLAHTPCMVWTRSYLDVRDPGPAGGRRDDEQREGAGKGEERVDAHVLKDEPPVVVVLCDTIGMRLEGGVAGVREEI